MTEIVTVEGPLADRRLEAVADLYGAVDAKYRHASVLEHLLVRSPAGPALHAFAVDGGRTVGHCAAVPMWARRGPERFRCAKVEALVVAASHRGRREGEQPVVLRLLENLVDAADAQDIELLHAFVRPDVGRVFVGFARIPAGGPSLVSVTRPGALGSRVLRLQGAALSVAQGAVRTLAALAVRARGSATLRPAEEADADLVAAALPPPGQWTVLADDAWDWFRAAPGVRVLEVTEARALIQLPGSTGDALRLVGWRSERSGVVPATRLLRAAYPLARDAGAATVRVQPWPAEPGDGALERACRLLGFVRRRDFTTLYVRARDPELARAGALAPTPLLSLGF